MAFTDAQVEQIVAGIRGGLSVIVGGSRSHSEYRGRNGELYLEEWDEGESSETPCLESDLRSLIASHPELFTEVVRVPLRAAVFEALAENRPAAVRAALDALYVFGDGMTDRALVEAVIAWPEEAPSDELIARFAKLDGLTVYHAIMSATGYPDKSAAVSRIGHRFFSALEAMLKKRELPFPLSWQKYRVDFRAMVG